MKKIALVLGFALVTACGSGNFSQVQADETGSASLVGSTETKVLDAQQIEVALTLFNDLYEAGVKLPFTSTGVCSKQTATIKMRVMDFNPASWTVTTATDGDVKLSSSQIEAALKLFNLLSVKGQRSGISYTATATISSRVCEMNPAVWTVTL